jgi:hypothetical protein
LQRLDLKTPIGPVRYGHWPSHSTPHTDALHYDEASLPRGHTIGLLVKNHSKSGAAVHRQSNVARGASSAVKLGGGGEEEGMVGGNVDCIKFLHSKTAVQNITSASPFLGSRPFLGVLKWRGVINGRSSRARLWLWIDELHVMHNKWRGCRLRAGQIMKVRVSHL